LKKSFMTAIALFVVSVSDAAILYDFQNMGGTFDNTNRAVVALSDGGINFTMTVSSMGGDLNSNDGYFGVGDDRLDGTSESIWFSFDVPVDISSIDLRLVGGDLTDGARITVGEQAPINMYTGSPTGPEFNGTLDIYTPSSALRLSTGSLVLTGSSVTSNFSLQGMSFSAVPEPAMTGLICLGGAFAFMLRRRAQ